MTRRGFTVIELTIGMTIMAFVLAAVMSLMVSMQRMLATSMSENELALAGREIREKLLFHAAPSADGMNYAGLLGAKNLRYDAGGVCGDTCAIGNGLDSLVDQEVAINLQSRTGGSSFYNSENPSGPFAKWLFPGGLLLEETSLSQLAVNHQPDPFKGFEELYSLVINFSLKGPDKNSIPGLVMREVIMIPYLMEVEQ